MLYKRVPISKVTSAVGPGAREHARSRRQGDGARGDCSAGAVVATVVVVVVGGTVLLGVPSGGSVCVRGRALVDVASGGERRQADRDARQALHDAQR